METNEKYCQKLKMPCVFGDQADPGICAECLSMTEKTLELEERSSSEEKRKAEKIKANWDLFRQKLERLKAGKITKILTHVNPDFDAFLSVATLRTITDKIIPIRYVEKDLQLPYVAEDEFPVDIEALKGPEKGNSAFAEFLVDYLPAFVIRQVHAQDCEGYSDLGIIINGLKAIGTSTDHILFDIMLPIVRGFVELKRREIETQVLVRKMEKRFIGDFKFLINPGQNLIGYPISRYARDHGCVGIIYKNTPENFGITRFAGLEEPNLGKLKGIKELKNFFFHPAGFMVAYGTRKHEIEDPNPAVKTFQKFLKILSSEEVQALFTQ
jgi:hypothetical protein